MSRTVLLPFFGRTSVVRHPLIAICLFLALAACAGERVSGAGEDFVPFGFSFTDPAGDTLAHDAASTRVALDLVGVSGTVDTRNLTITLSFTSSIAPWSRQAAGSVDGFIDFDLDENSATGIPGAAEEFGGSAPLGAEYYISLRDIEPGHVALIEVATYTARIAPATWSGSTMRITIPRAGLPDADGQFRLSVVIGHPDLPATDFAPSDGYYTVHR